MVTFNVAKHHVESTSVKPVPDVWCPLITHDTDDKSIYVNFTNLSKMSRSQLGYLYKHREKLTGYTKIRLTQVMDNVDVDRNVMTPEARNAHDPARPFRVEIIESEAGWGQRVDDVMTFATREDAEKFCENYNKDNNLPETPSWYMYARVVN